MSYLDDYLRRAVARWPDHVAVEEPDGSRLTYRELAELARGVRDHLVRLGVRRGDRVGICLHKSIDSMAVLLGVLEAQAAYVPVDVGAPAARNAYIFDDCRVRVAFVEASVETALRNELCDLGSAPFWVALDGVGGGGPLRQAIGAEEPDSEPEAVTEASEDDVAYILYTSGSTGRPKGVILTHRNAISFVEWCSRTFSPEPGERFSSHAPFHFDLSILDLYLPLKHGGTVVLIGEDLGKDPVRLAALIEEKRLTSWYSAPSILSLLAQYGGLEDRDLSSLGRVLFAGEVFPVKHLRRLTEILPAPRYFNLYGPTETNVCTYLEIPLPVPEERSEPYPIGPVCDHLEARVVGAGDLPVAPGEEGELLISGPAVMDGYWNLVERSRAAFLGADDQRWYRTGDVVVEGDDGVFTFVGRRDRMVKRRGYRIELGEIEAALYGHGELSEVAVVALPSEEGVRIQAHYATSDGRRVGLISLKRFCAENLPLYMVPDGFVHHEALPKTSTDKIDYQTLKGSS